MSFNLAIPQHTVQLFGIIYVCNQNHWVFSCSGDNFLAWYKANILFLVKKHLLPWFSFDLILSI